MTPDLAQKIYKTNFMLLSKSDLDNDGVSNNVELSQGGDPYTKMHVSGSDPIINLPVNFPLSSIGHEIRFISDNGAANYKADHLPPGLSINNETGILEGMPTKVGRYYVNVSARTGSREVISKVWTVFIEAHPAIKYGTTHSIKEGSPFSLRATTEKYSWPLFQVVNGDLPPGLALDSYQGDIKGIPNNLTEAEYIVTISATNSAGTSSSRIIFVVR